MRKRTRHRPRLAPDSVAADLRDQQAPAYEQVRGYLPAVEPVAPGRIVLATPHVPTTVRLDDIESVTKVQPRGTLALRGLVTLVDGERHFVPDPAAVLRAMREAKAC